MKVDKRIKSMPWPEPYKTAGNQDFAVTLNWPNIAGERVLVATFSANREKKRWKAAGQDFRLICSKKNNTAAVLYQGDRAGKRHGLNKALGTFACNSASCYPEITERDEARKKAAEMEKTMEEQLEAAENRVEGYAKELKAAKEKAAADMEKAQRDIDSLKAELEEVAAGPAAVAVETVVDEEAVKAAAEAAREKTAAELKTKIEKAEKAKERAEQAKAKAEQDLAAVKVAQEEAQAVANREKQAMAEQVQDLQKKLAVASSSEMTIFKLHFEQGQTSINKMSDCITNMAEAGDVEGAEKLKNALRALLNSTLEVLR